MKPNMIVSISLIGLFVACVVEAINNTKQLNIKHDELSRTEVSFPDLFSMGEDRISLITQIVTSGGFETREEIVDRRFGTQTILMTNDKYSKSFFIDRNRGIVQYMPYSCKKVSKLEMTEDAMFSGLLTFSTGSLTVYGIAALWLNAKYNDHIWTQTTTGQWEADDESTKNRFKIVGRLSNDEKNIQLESVQISTKGDDNDYKIHTWINIISLEKPRRNDLLQVPIGYGCIIDDKPLSLDSVQIPIDFDARFFALQFEISATKYNSDSTTATTTTTTDFIGLELVYSALHGLQLIRRKESTKDSKIIVDLKNRVTYELDELRGSCLRNHNRKSLDTSSQDESHFLDTKVTFSNGLSLDLSVDKLKKLFSNVEEFYLIKINSPDDSPSEYYHYYEAKILNKEDFVIGYITRRYYKSISNSALKLTGISVRYLSSDHTKIDSSYHINLIDLIDPENERFNLIANSDQNSDSRNPALGKQLMQLAKLFDISDECYLENENMRAGHDFIWTEMSYMLPSQELKSLQSQRDLLEASLYNQLLNSFSTNGLTLLRVPKFEVIISLRQDLLIIRWLTLDMPSLNLIYTKIENLLINPMASYGDQVDFARDLDHCTNLCRLNHCQLMSFGQQDHKCILSHRPPNEHTNKTVDNYKTFYYEQVDDKVFDFKTLIASSLQKLMRIIQSRQYDDYVIPKKDEMIERPPEIDSGEYTLEEYRQKAEEYWQSILQAMPTEEDKKFLFRYTAKSGLDHQFVPKTYKFEADPLAEFNLDNVDKNNLIDLEEETPTFHRGFPFYRFKPNLDLIKYQAHYFTGISIEQCELACLDGSCSSYSYCESKNRGECTITNIHKFVTSTDGSNDDNIDQMPEIMSDSDCYIAQRDFLSKYNRFENVLSPQTSGDIIQQTKVLNPSECAYQCFINSPKEPCLAFDYCLGPAGELPECYMLKKREIYTGVDDPTYDPDSKKPDHPDQETGCDHYSRSYLADFWRIEYTEIKPDELVKLHPTTFTGLTVDSCADKCVTEDNKCTGFQFCFIGDQPVPKLTDDSDDDDNMMTQTCKLIDSPARQELEIDEDEQGKATKKGSFIIPSPGLNCHLFIMRSDASEAKLRDLAFNGTKPVNPNNGDDDANPSTGLTFLTGLIIYMCVTVVFAGIGSGFVLLKHNSSRFRQQVERFSIYMRVRRS